MSEASRDLGASAEPNKVGPDWFAFYTHEVAELLSQDDDFLPFSSETSELVGRTFGVVGDRAISRHNYNGKDKIVLGSLFCNPTGSRLSDIKKERLKALLRQSVFALSQEVDEVYFSLSSMCVCGRVCAFGFSAFTVECFWEELNYLY